MKPTKKIAALLAAATVTQIASSPFFTLPRSAVFAEDTGAIATLPDWVPKDLASTVDFRNTYGATHIEDGLVCVVSKLQWDPGPDDEPHGVLRYETLASDDSVRLLRHANFAAPDGSYFYDIAVFDPQQECDFDIAVIDTWAEETDSDLRYGHAITRYYFSAENDMNITENDIYGWLPDCSAEFSAYTRQNGILSVKDNYVIFCLTTVPQFGDRWEPDSTNPYQKLKLFTTSDCTTEATEIYADGAISTVYAYQAKTDGYETITWNRTSSARPDQQDASPLTVTADCAIFDNGESVLLANTARIRFIDADNGKMVSVPYEDQTIPLAPTIAYKSDQEDVYAYADLALTADSNPFYWDCSPYKDADIFEINLFPDALPEQYVLPKEYKNIREFENGARDVVFFLQEKSSISREAKANITLLDYDTGELIRINSDTEFMLVEPDYAWGGDTENAIAAKITTNPCTIENLKLNGCELETPPHYQFPYEEGTNHISRDYREIITNKDGGYDITYRLKFVPTGDITGDRRFLAEDITEMEKWLVNDDTANAGNWKAVDYNNDDSLDARDYSLMMQAYIAKRQTPTAIAITTYGGVEGLHVEWNVYSENGKYLLTYWDKTAMYINTLPPETNKITVELTENQYREIMSIDYDSIIEEYNAIPKQRVMDDIHQYTVLTFADGSERTTYASMSEVLTKLKQLINLDKTKDI